MLCPNGEFPSTANAQWDTALAPYKKIIMKQDEKIAELTRKLDDMKTSAISVTATVEADQQMIDHNGVSLIRKIENCLLDILILFTIL